MKDPKKYLCLQWGICYTDALSAALSVSHDTKLFG